MGEGESSPADTLFKTCSQQARTRLGAWEEENKEVKIAARAEEKDCEEAEENVTVDSEEGEEGEEDEDEAGGEGYYGSMEEYWPMSRSETSCLPWENDLSDKHRYSGANFDPNEPMPSDAFARILERLTDPSNPNTVTAYTVLQLTRLGGVHGSPQYSCIRLEPCHIITVTPRYVTHPIIGGTRECASWCDDQGGVPAGGGRWRGDGRGQVADGGQS